MCVSFRVQFCIWSGINVAVLFAGSENLIGILKLNEWKNINLEYFGREMDILVPF